MPPKGCPPKKKRNISGLQNQQPPPANSFSNPSAQIAGDDNIDQAEINDLCQPDLKLEAWRIKQVQLNLS